MPPLSWSHPVPCHVFHSVPDPLHGHSHYPEGYSIGMRVVRPHTFPLPHCSSVVWRWVLGNSPAALHEKGAPIVPSLPLKSFVLSVLPVSVCHSLEFRAPRASLPSLPEGLPNSRGCQGLEPAGSRPWGALPSNLPLPFLGSLSSLPPSLLCSSTLPPFASPPQVCLYFSSFLPPSFFLPLTWLLCCDIYFCIISFFLW